MILAAANLALLAGAVAVVRWTHDGVGEAPALPESLCGALLYGLAGIGALCLGMAPGGIGRRLIAFGLALGVVLAGFSAIHLALADGETPWSFRHDIEPFLISVVAPYLCVGGGLSVLRVMSGPITLPSKRAWEFDVGEATTLVALLLVICGAIGWAMWKNGQNEASLIDLTSLLLAAPNTIAQLAGAAAFALAKGAVWRIVGFTYMVCIALQGFMNADPRGLAAFVSATGPWIVVLANLLALRLVGYRFANSHPRPPAQSPSEPSAPAAQ